MKLYLQSIAAWVAIIAAFIGIGIWVQSIQTKIEGLEKQPAVVGYKEIERKLNNNQNKYIEIENQIKTLVKKDSDINSKIKSIESKVGKLVFKKDCVERKYDCDGSKFRALRPPEGYIDTGIDISNTFAHSPCGQGPMCKLYYKIEN